MIIFEHHSCLVSQTQISNVGFTIWTIRVNVVMILKRNSKEECKLISLRKFRGLIYTIIIHMRFFQTKCNRGYKLIHLGKFTV